MDNRKTGEEAVTGGIRRCAQTAWNDEVDEHTCHGHAGRGQQPKTVNKTGQSYRAPAGGQPTAQQPQQFAADTRHALAVPTEQDIQGPVRETPHPCKQHETTGREPPYFVHMDIEVGVGTGYVQATDQLEGDGNRKAPMSEAGAEVPASLFHVVIPYQSNCTDAASSLAIQHQLVQIRHGAPAPVQQQSVMELPLPTPVYATKHYPINATNELQRNDALLE